MLLFWNVSAQNIPVPNAKQIIDKYVVNVSIHKQYCIIISNTFNPEFNVGIWLSAFTHMRNYLVSNIQIKGMKITAATVTKRAVFSTMWYMFVYAFRNSLNFCNAVFKSFLCSHVSSFFSSSFCSFSSYIFQLVCDSQCYLSPLFNVARKYLSN